MTSAWLSGVIVARDAGEMIDACLASLAGVDELVVVDHASTDDTATRAAQAGARVVRMPAEASLGALRARAHACMADGLPIPVVNMSQSCTAI